jgi:hypothetical protein
MGRIYSTSDIGIVRMDEIATPVPAEEDVDHAED